VKVGVVQGTGIFDQIEYEHLISNVVEVKMNTPTIQLFYVIGLFV